MAMSRKHYQAVADLISEEISPLRPEKDGTDAAVYAAVERVAEGLADLFKADNSSFDRQRFLGACEL